MKMSTTRIFQHSIFAPDGYKFTNFFHPEYQKVFGAHDIEICESGKVLRVTDMHWDHFAGDSENIDWEEFMDEHLTDLLIKDA